MVSAAPKAVLVFSSVLLLGLLGGPSCSSTSTNQAAGGAPSTGGAAGAGTGGVDAGGSGGSAGATSGGSAGSGGAAGADASTIVDAEVDAAPVCRGKEDVPICGDGQVSSGICPKQGDTIKWSCIDPITGDAELQNVTQNRTYFCSLAASQPSAGEYDCTSQTMVGTTMDISSLGNSPGVCFCTATFTFGLPACTYDCVAAD